MLRPLLLCLALSAGPVWAATDIVELDYRPRPNRDQVLESVVEGRTTVRVLEDRGIVAKSQAQAVVFPLTTTFQQRQTLHTTTGAPAADGSYGMTVEVVAQGSALTLPDGREQALPVKVPLQGLKVRGTLTADGHIVPASVETEVENATPQQREMLQQLMTAMMQQIPSWEPVQLRRGETVPQHLKMTAPVPGMKPLDMQMTIHQRLLDVHDGVAQIDMVYTLSFQGDDAVALQAGGSGHGTLNYEVATQTMLSSVSETTITFVTDTNDGKLQFETATRQQQTMRPAQKR